MEMDIRLGDGRKVDASWGKFTVPTDQGVESGGAASAPEPYDLFLASIGTCAGVNVVYFCEKRGLDIAGIKMTLAFDRNETKHLVEAVRIHFDLPPGFPQKYKNTIIKTAGLCAVKRNIIDPPEFIITAAIQE